MWMYKNGNGVIKKRRVWLEELIGDCEEEIEKLEGLGYYIGLEIGYNYFNLRVLYRIDGDGCGRIKIENKSGKGTMSYTKRDGSVIISIKQNNIKALLNRIIIEECEEERNAEVGV